MCIWVEYLHQCDIYKYVKKSVIPLMATDLLELHSQEINSWAHHHFHSWAHELVDAQFLQWLFIIQPTN